MADRWSSQDNVKFVDLYKDQSNLWNIFDPNYKNRDLRKASLEYLAQEMNLKNVHEVTKKIKNLRSTYKQELLKIEKSKKSGSSADNIYKPTIKWFDAMHNIMTIINLKEKKTTSNLQRVSSVSEENREGDSQESQGQEGDSQKGARQESERQESDRQKDKNQEIIKRPRPVKPKRGIKRPLSSGQPTAIQTAINQLKELNKGLSNPVTPQIEDECDLIGRHVAIQLRELPLIDRIDAKDEIQQILSRYRKKTLLSSTTTSYYTSSPQPTSPFPIIHAPSTSTSFTSYSTPSPDTKHTLEPVTNYLDTD